MWDASTLSRMLGDHLAMHKRLLDKFLPGSVEQVVAIMNAAAAGGMVKVAGVAHKMKSAAWRVGAMRLRRICQELEISGRAGDTGAVNSHAAALETAFLEAVRHIINSYAQL